MKLKDRDSNNQSDNQECEKNEFEKMSQENEEEIVIVGSSSLEQEENGMKRIFSWISSRLKSEKTNNGPKLYSKRWGILLIYGLTLLISIMYQSTFSSIRYLVNFLIEITTN